MERKKKRIGLLGRIGIGLLGIVVERERQRIGLLGRIGEEASDWSIGSCRGKEMAENRPVGCCR